MMDRMTKQGHVESVVRKNGVICRNPECKYEGADCETCGWNTVEAERRGRLPLVGYVVETVDEHGNLIKRTRMRRKCVGCYKDTDDEGMSD